MTIVADRGSKPSQLGLAKAREALGELVRRVSEDGEVVHLARRGRPVATLIAPERLASLEASAADFGRLAEVTQALITTLDVRVALDRLVRVTVGWLGETCIVDLVEDGTWRCVALAAATGVTDLDAAGLQLVVGADPLDKLALPGPRRVAPGDAGAERWSKMLTSLGADEGIVAPLVRGDRLLGALVVASSTSIDDRLARLADEVARRASVIVDNARLYAEQRSVAERFQHYLLADLPAVSGARLAARYAGAPHMTEVGGDWYDAFTLPDGSLGLVIGDVIGHDVDAAVHMSQLRNLLRAVAWMGRADPATIVTELDRIWAGLVLGPEALATLIVAVLSQSPGGTWRLRWANAGHLAPLVVEGSREPAFLERPADTLLGAPAAAPRSTHEVELHVPATLLLYTDGLIERRSETLERSATRLRRSVQKLPVDDPEQLCDGLIAGVRPDHDDDIAVLAVRLIE